MDRIVRFSILLICIACSTSKKKTSNELTLTEKNNYYSSQASLENIINGDLLFLGLKNSICIKDWDLGHNKNKDGLIQNISMKGKVTYWFGIGTCYAYTKTFKKTFYYYELILSQPNLSGTMISKINFNIGQIYESRAQLNLAKIYYTKALSGQKIQALALLKLALLDLAEHEFRSSIVNLKKLERLESKSELVWFLIGVNYFHLNEKERLINKVLNKIDEKSIGSILLRMALDVVDNKNTKNLEADLRSFDVKFKLHQDFKNYILKRLGS